MGTSVLIPTDTFQLRDGTLHCEDVPVDELVTEYGTPLYIYSKRAFVERYRTLERAFEGANPMIAYSVKANGNLSILRLLAEEGAGADIVSGGELHRALQAGIPAERIVFSGVGKTVTEMAEALSAGIYAFNVESEAELRSLSALAHASGHEAPIALRVNPDIETPTPHAYTRTGHRATKFGVPSEDALSLYRLAERLPGIRVRGIDLHIGSQITEVEPYRRALVHVLEIAKAIQAEGIPLEFVDMGGGFGIAYDDEDEGAATAQDFADVIVPGVVESGLDLVLEPGRFIAGPAGVLLTRVLYIKEMGGKTFVITDAGMNDLLRPSHYAGYHIVEPAEEYPGREPMRVDVVGPICETGDFLALDRELPRVEQGETLAVRTVGAYGFVMASQYNARPRPAEVLVDGAEARLIRRRETYTDLIRGETEFLKGP